MKWCHCCPGFRDWLLFWMIVSTCASLITLVSCTHVSHKSTDCRFDWLQDRTLFVINADLFRLVLWRAWTHTFFSPLLFCCQGHVLLINAFCDSFVMNGERTRAGIAARLERDMRSCLSPRQTGCVLGFLISHGKKERDFWIKETRPENCLRSCEGRVRSRAGHKWNIIHSLILASYPTPSPVIRAVSVS